jgi:hypothetical protein
MIYGIFLWGSGFCFALGETFFLNRMGLLHTRLQHVCDAAAVIVMAAGIAFFLLAMAHRRAT